MTNGFFGGLASVVGFLPQLAILFLFLSILEDSGYMSRAAFIMDRALRQIRTFGKIVYSDASRVWLFGSGDGFDADVG
ncbi:MAG: hypothetical protein MZU97_16580 [Bacillus subtilis]|nr:hypothetical protein [Bacillus subtilis]